jgi:YHS domain-containing protein
MRTYILIFGIVMLFSSTSCASRVVVRPAHKTTIVKVAPKHHKIVVVKGKRYYFWNGKHYRKTKKGYVLVRV